MGDQYYYNPNYPPPNTAENYNYYNSYFTTPCASQPQWNNWNNFSGVNPSSSGYQWNGSAVDTSYPPPSSSQQSQYNGNFYQTPLPNQYQTPPPNYLQNSSSNDYKDDLESYRLAQKSKYINNGHHKWNRRESDRRSPRRSPSKSRLTNNRRSKSPQRKKIVIDIRVEINGIQDQIIRLIDQFHVLDATISTINN